MTEKEMIQKLTKDGYISSKEIIRAMGEIHREQFVLEEERSRAYENLPLSTGGGLFVSQPSTAGFLLELLKPKHGEKILVIGAGTGWIAGISTTKFPILLGLNQRSSYGSPPHNSRFFALISFSGITESISLLRVLSCL